MELTVLVRKTALFTHDTALKQVLVRKTALFTHDTKGAVQSDSHRGSLRQAARY